MDAADAFMQAWSSGAWISNAAEYPAAPSSASAVYATHLEMQRHQLAASLGGHGGYKIGAVGLEGEACWYAPLFGRFIVEAPGNDLSAAAIHIHQVEPEFGLILGDDLPQKADGVPYSVGEVWAAVEEVVLCIECCGQRASPDVIAGTTRLGKFNDALSAGGVVLGPRLPAASLEPSSLASCATELLLNGARIAEGSGAACFGGGPAEAVTWLANHLNGRGLGLQRGQLVATGQTCIARDFQPGDRVTGVFHGLGRIEMVVAP